MTFIKKVLLWISYGSRVSKMTRNIEIYISRFRDKVVRCDLIVAKRVGLLEEDNNPEEIKTNSETCSVSSRLSFFAHAILQFPILILYSEKIGWKTLFDLKHELLVLSQTPRAFPNFIFRKRFGDIVQFHLPLTVEVSSRG